MQLRMVLIKCSSLDLGADVWFLALLRILQNLKVFMKAYRATRERKELLYIIICVDTLKLTFSMLCRNYMLHLHEDVKLINILLFKWFLKPYLQQSVDLFFSFQFFLYLNMFKKQVEASAAKLKRFTYLTCHTAGFIKW